MIKAENGKLYTGITRNITQRLATHNNQKGAQFTKTGMFSLVFYESYSTPSKARQREIQIKKWSRSKKEKLIERYKNNLSTKQNE